MQGRELALKTLIKNAVMIERKRELDLYKKYASDPDFEKAFDASIARLLTMRPEQLGGAGLAAT